MSAAHVPSAVRFATKPRLAVAMIERALAADVPFAWVAADTVYGVGEVETALRRAGKGYVLGVACKHPFRSWGRPRAVCGTAEAIADDLRETAWRRLSAGEGTKGARLHDWCYIELADLDPTLFAATSDTAATRGTEPGPDGSTPNLWTRGLLIRRSIADGKLAFFSTWCPAGTAIDTLVLVEGRRWSIEDSFETAKNEFGLDHNETRSWHGWHRHVSLVMLVFAMMATIRHHANAMTLSTTTPAKATPADAMTPAKAAPPKTIRRPKRPSRPSSAGRSRRSDASPRGSRNEASSPPTSSPGHAGDAPTKPPLNEPTST